MKAILEFELPQDQEDHLTALNGAAWRDVVWDLSQLLRNQAKYTDKESIPIEEIRSELYTIIQAHGLSLD